MRACRAAAAIVALGLGLTPGRALWAGPPLTATPQPARTETRPPGGFTFHMVKPPSPGTTRFIKVQIDPEVQKRWIEDAPAVTEHRTPDPADKPVTAPAAAQVADGAPWAAHSPNAGSPKPAYAWYWKAISPALNDREGRFQAALAELSLGPGGTRVRAPRLTRLQALSQAWGTDILKATVGTKVSPALVLAVMSVESAGKVDAVSPKGARGLMQLIPATAGRFGVDASDPAQNIQGAVAYLDWLMGTFKGDPLMVLAAYNAGENAVKAAGGVPDFAETRDYVPKVLAAWQVAQHLCVTPPQTIHDGCVFKEPATASNATAVARSDG